MRDASCWMKHEEPLALAFHGSDGWVAGSFLCRNPSVPLIELFESVNGEIFQEDRAVWAAAVREYFSTALAETIPPSIDDLNPTRNGILTTLIKSIWGEGAWRDLHRLLLRFGCRFGSPAGAWIFPAVL